MARERLAHAAREARAERDLHGAVAVLLGGLDLGDPVVGDVQHRDRQRAAVVGEDSRHADLAADQSNRHTFLCLLIPAFAGTPAAIGRHFTCPSARFLRSYYYWTLISTSTPAGRSSFIKAST